MARNRSWACLSSVVSVTRVRKPIGSPAVPHKRPTATRAAVGCPAGAPKALFEDGRPLPGQDPGEEGLLALPVRGEGEIAQVAAQQRLARIAKDRAITVIHAGQVAVEIDLGHPGQALVDQDAQA